MRNSDTIKHTNVIVLAQVMFAKQNCPM